MRWEPTQKVGYEMGYNCLQSGVRQNSRILEENGADRCREFEQRSRLSKPYKMYDREGLFLLVNPGGSKLWRWRYWVDGKEKLMALGEYPIVNLARGPRTSLCSSQKGGRRH